jgi:hypothetical protein
MSRPRRRGLIRRLFRWFLVAGGVLLLLLAAAVGVVRSGGASEPARRAAVTIGSRLLGADLFIQHIDVTAIFPPRAVVTGLTLHSRSGNQAGLPLVRFDHLDVALTSLPDPRDRLVAIERATVVGPAARVALVDGVLRDFEPIIARFRRTEPKPENAQPWGVQLAVLDVQDADVRVSLEPAGLGFLVADLDLGLEQDDRGRGEGRLSIDALELEVGELRERGRLDEGTFAIEDGRITLQPQTLYLGTGLASLEGVVELPKPPGSDEPGGLAYSVAAHVDLDLDRLQDAWPKLPPILGELGVTVGVVGKGGPPRVSFTLEGEDVAVKAYLKLKERWATYRAGTFTLIGDLEGGRVSLRAGSVVQYGGGTVHLTGGIDLSGDLPFDAVADIRGVALERILANVTIPGSFCAFDASGVIRMAGKVKNGFGAKGQGSVDIRNLVVTRGPWNAPVAEPELLRVPVAHVETGLTLGPGTLTLAPAIISGPNSSLDVTTVFHLGQKPLGLDIRILGGELDMDDLNNEIVLQEVDGRGRIAATIKGPSNRLIIDGSLELADFVFRNWGFGAVAGNVRWEAPGDLEFTALRGRKGSSDFEAEVRVLFPDRKRGGSRDETEILVEALVPEGHGRAEDLLPIFFSNDLGAKGDVWGRAELSGPPARLQGAGIMHGDAMTYLWEDFETLDLDVRIVDGDLVVQEGWARKASGNAIFGRGTVGREVLDFEFRLPRLAIGELKPIRSMLGLDSALTGTLHGGAVLTGAVKDLKLRANVQLDDLELRGERLGDSSVELAIADGQLHVTGDLLDHQGTARAEMTLRGIWPYEFGVAWKDIDLEPVLPRKLLGRQEPMRGAIGGQLNGAGTLKDRWSDIALVVDQLWLERGGHRIEAPQGRPLLLSLSGGAYRLDEVELASPDGSTDVRIEGWLRPDGPMALSIKGPVDFSFADLVVDSFDRAEARALVLDLSLKGMSTASVDIEGSAVLKDALVRTVYFPHEVEIDRAEVSLRNRLVKLDVFEGRLGGGVLEGVAGSTIRLDHTGYRPREYDLHAKCERCTVRYPSFLPPSTGNFALNFRGISPDRLVLSGDIHIDDMVQRDPLNWQRSALRIGERATANVAGEGGEGLFGLDLRFTSAPEAIRMQNNVGDIRASAVDFRVAGDTRRVLLLGALQIDGGTLPYNGRTFELQPGTATFKEGASWWPELDMRMATEIVNRQEVYRISYTITGPLNSPTLVASSEPALSMADVNSLLLFDLTQEQLAEADLTQLAAAATSTALGTLVEGAATSLGQSVDNTALPDTFEIVPVYTDATGATTVWAVATKEVVEDLLTLEGGFGLGGTRSSVVSSVARAQFRFTDNFYLEGSWVRDDDATQDYGNFGLDFKWRFDLR